MVREEVQVAGLFTSSDPRCCTGHASWVLSIACHPDGDAFATASSDSKVMLWDLRSQSSSQTLTEHSDQVGAPQPASCREAMA